MSAVVAAIDFGTHGTGYAWTEVGEDLAETLRRQPNYRERWPGTESYYPKDLSAVLLGPDGQVIAWGHEAKYEWARLAANGHHADYGYAVGFKMALKASAYGALQSPGSGAARIDTAEQAYPLVVAYLQRIYQMALAEIQKSGYPDNQIRWCLTVPAIWDDAEKQLMRDAARDAGMPSDRDRLLLTIEPEAAAVYCRVHLARVIGGQPQERRQIVEPGTRFMVVDCGGGTVDITAFRVVAAPDGGNRMIEIGKVSGGKLGSEVINQAFIEEVLYDRLGGPEVLEQIRRDCPHALLELVERWESQKVTVKVQHGGDGSEPAIARPIYLPVPGEVHELMPPAAIERLAAQAGGTRHRIVVTPPEAAKLFDKVVDTIIELVGEQLDEMQKQDGPRDEPERILLVGGLSGSEYLQERLARNLDGPVTLLVPPNPAAAVLFGAVLYGCDTPVIQARRARYTYGHRIARPFEPGRDPVDKRLADPNGQVLCKDRFNVLVANGDLIEAGRRAVQVLRPLRADQARVNLKFFRTLKRDPRYIDEEGCEQIGSLTVDLGTAMQLPLGQRRVEIEMQFGGTDISASAKNVHTQQRVQTSLRFGDPG